MRGANLTVKPGYVHGGAANQVWSDLWDEWDWTNWIKWQIDLAVTAGANCIRLQGAVGGVARGQFTRATYEARLRQLVAYCDSLGLGFYATGAGEYSTPRTQATIDELVHMGEVLSEYSNVVAFELFQEWDVWQSILGVTEASIIETLTDWYDAVKASACTLPVTFSGTSNASTIRVREIADFLDRHLYSNPTLSEIEYLSFFKSRVMIGEFGQAMNAGTPARQSRYTSVRDAINAWPFVYGALAWAVVDQATDANPEDQWGMFDNTGTRRTDVSSIYDSFPTSR